jgi:hypothetical protein
MRQERRPSTQPSFRNERMGLKKVGRVSVNRPRRYRDSCVRRNVSINDEGAAFTSRARGACVSEIELLFADY